MIGVYAITNTINGKKYIGSSVNLMLRKTYHFSTLRHSRHPNKHLQASFIKYGENCFIFEVIKECPIEELLSSEKFYIDSLETLIKGYNQAPEPGCGSRGVKWSKESKDKLSRSLISAYQNNTRKRIVITHSDEVRHRISKASMGRIPTNRRKVFCHQTDTVYSSLHEAAKSLNMCVSSVCDILHNRRKSSKGYTFEYKEDNKNE